jgi:hypothetical protein
MLLDLNFPTEKNILKWNSKSSALFEYMEGRPKTDKDIIKRIQKHFIKNVIQNRDILPADYKYFGNDNSVENLELFVANNPFFASALTSSKDEISGKNSFWLKSFKDNKDTETYFQRLVTTLDDSYMRVNVKFDENLKVSSVTSFSKGKEVKPSDQDACSALILVLIFYSEVVHANIHIFHTLMVTAMADSTFPFKAIHEWASPYFTNVYLKFKEVKMLLFGEGGALTGGVYKSNRNEVLNICLDMFCVWGQCNGANDFITKFLLAGLTNTYSLEQIAAAGILTEFFKHANLISPYANDLNREFKKINNGIDLKLVNENLKLFLLSSKSEFPKDLVVSTVDNIVTWIELMTVTGIVHGSTLSFTRLIMTNPIISIITPSDKYGPDDTFFMKGGSATIVGMMEEHSVYSDQMQEKTFMSPVLKSIIYKYAGLSSKLKWDYYEKISKDPNFVNNGWVLTDNCSDGIDGKQLTLTTYI